MLSVRSGGGLGVGEGLGEVGPCSHSQGPDTAMQQCVLACRFLVLCSKPLSATFPLWLWGSLLPQTEKEVGLRDLPPQDHIRQWFPMLLCAGCTLGTARVSASWVLPAWSSSFG